MQAQGVTMNKELLKEIEERVNIVMIDNPEYKEVFKSLKSDLITAYLKNDFRLSVLKDFASRLIAIIDLASNNSLPKI